MNCPMCGCEVASGAKFCQICGATVANNQQPPQQVQQHLEPQMPKPKKEKKKKKNVAIKVIAAVLALVILAGGGLFLVDSIMFKKEVEAKEIITDFPVLKQKTEFLVYDAELFPSNHYKITVERVITGNVLKSDAFRQTKVIIEDESTEPVYNIDFEEDGEYIITLEDISDEAETVTTTQVETTTAYNEPETETETEAETKKEPETEESLIVVIRAKVDDASEEALDKVDVNSKKGDKPVEITTTAPNEDGNKDNNKNSSSDSTLLSGDTISAGGMHTVGLKADGTVIAAGDSDDGQFDVSGWKDIVAVSVGDTHIAGLKRDGTVVTVGYNDNGQCDVSDWKDIVAISADRTHTVGLKSDGTVVAVGGNDFDFGQCDVSGWKDIVAVAAGLDHTVGLKSDGTVVAVGDNGEGQCDVSGWNDIVAVTAGCYFTVGLKSDGTVVYVGFNGDGEYDVSDWTDIIAVSAGYHHVVGLKSDGTVVAEGSDYYNQIDVSGWRDIVAVEAGDRHTVGLKSDGTVVAVGDNYYGQCDVSGWTDIKTGKVSKPSGSTTTDKDNDKKPVENTTGDWAAAYREFLLDYDTDEFHGEDGGFSLCYINNDDIPELIVGIAFGNGAHFQSASVYTYYNGEVSFVCKGGGCGEIEYLERGNMICSYYSSTGATSYNIYEIVDGTGNLVWDGDDNINMELDEVICSSFDVDIPRDEYEDLVSKYYPADKLSSSGDNSYLLTEENVNKYVK